MKKIATITFISLLSLHLFGKKIWNSDDRTILLEGLEKTKIELINEVQNLLCYRSNYCAQELQLDLWLEMLNMERVKLISFIKKWHSI